MSGTDPERLARVAARIAALLRAREETLAVAESCTGGLIAAALSGEPGASEFFWGAAVVYSNAAKRVLAGIDEEVLARHGPVAAPTSRALAIGVRERSGATWGLAVTGWAGPDAGDGGSVGTVHAAVADGREATTTSSHVGGTRDEVRRGAALEALRLLRARLGETEDQRA